MKVVASIVLVFTCSFIARPCSCVQVTTSTAEQVKWQLSEAGVVFEGKASDYLQEPGSDRVCIRFAVDKVWKGDMMPEFELATDTMLAPNGPVAMNSCEYPFGAGKTYIVFAIKTKKGWATGDCSGTTEVRGKDWDQEVLKALGPSSEPKKIVSFLLPIEPFQLSSRTYGG